MKRIYDIIISRKKYRQVMGRRLPNARRRRKMLKAGGVYRMMDWYLANA